MTVEHRWHLYSRTGHNIMVIACPLLRIAKSLRQPDSICEEIVRQSIVKSYVDSYYQGAMVPGTEPEDIELHKNYMSRAYILCTYEVEL